MDDTFDTLRQNILRAVEEQRTRPKTNTPSRQQQVMAEFIHLQLVKLGVLEDQFAARAALTPEQARMLLEGTLPAAQLSDAMLERVAAGIEVEANILRVMMGRPRSEAGNGESSTAGDASTA